MNSFPLYENLSKDIKDEELKSEEEEDFIEMVKNLGKDDDGNSLMYALIKIYQIENGNPSSFILPYGGKQLKQGIKFDLKVFPNKLKQILYKFLRIHLKSKEEDERLEIQRF
jgi:hypothetical protein